MRQNYAPNAARYKNWFFEQEVFAYNRIHRRIPNVVVVFYGMVTVHSLGDSLKENCLEEYEGHMYKRIDMCK